MTEQVTGVECGLVGPANSIQSVYINHSAPPGLPTIVVQMPASCQWSGQGGKWVTLVIV